MIVVSHEMGFARSAAQRVAFMDGGRIVEIATPQRFFDHPETDRAKDFPLKILAY
jgi:glutamate transport system ATP-binding protein